MLAAQLSEEERYKDCDRFKFTCPACKKEIIFDGVFTGTGSSIHCRLEPCPGQKCNYKLFEHVGVIMNKLSAEIRRNIKKYYEGWMKCDDSTCAARTRKLPLQYFRGHVTCQVCHRGKLVAEYADTALYIQLCYYQFIFDLPKAMELLVDEDRVFARRVDKFEEQHLALKSLVASKVKQNAYSEVNLTKLFVSISEALTV